jgi:exodeoxyribonuclease VII large subunit
MSEADLQAFLPATPGEPAILTISALNRLARQRLEAAFPLQWVAGEISNLTIAASGHVYFSLKDASAQARCVMFRNKAQMTGFKLTNGQKVEARVLVSLYEPRGDFQLNVESLRRAGLGNLYEQFLRLKAKLEAEGLFAAERKRPLPAFPRRIGIVTSLQAAALRDVLTTLRRRAPQVSAIVYPTPVQGDGAAAQIAEAIRQAGERNECELLIVCRGGGSLEDLWAFNEEAVARAVAACPLPVIAGVGHETDVTLIDFVADRRAPTPTAAAELAAPARSALLGQLEALAFTLSRRMQRALQSRSQRLDWLARGLKHPAERIAERRAALGTLARRLCIAGQRRNEREQARLSGFAHRFSLARPSPAQLSARLERLATRLQQAPRQIVQTQRSALARLASNLTHLNPEAVLARGYSIVANEQGQIVRDAADLPVGSTVRLRFERGQAEATVTSSNKDGNIPG